MPFVKPAAVIMLVFWPAPPIIMATPAINAMPCLTDPMPLLSVEASNNDKRRRGRTPPMPALMRNRRGFLKFLDALRKERSRLEKRYMRKIARFSASKMEPVNSGTPPRAGGWASAIRKSNPNPDDNPEEMKTGGMNRLFQDGIARDSYTMKPWHNISIKAAPADRARIATEGVTRSIRTADTKIRRARISRDIHDCLILYSAWGPLKGRPASPMTSKKPSMTVRHAAGP